LIDIAIEREMRAGRELVDIEQRHGAARDLLRTAIGVAVKRLQDRRRIERGGQACRQRHSAGAWHQIGEHVR